MAVLPVGADDRVIRSETGYGAGRHRLLTDVEMEEAADLAPAVEFGALLLKPPDAEHLAEQLKGVSAVYNGVHFLSITGTSHQLSALSVQLSVLSVRCPCWPNRKLTADR